jgi:hypothetical protein
LNLAVIHNHHAVRERHRFRLIVRDIDRRHAEPSLDCAKLVTHLQPQFGVEIAERLIEQKNFWLNTFGFSFRYTQPSRNGEAGLKNRNHN